MVPSKPKKESSAEIARHIREKIETQIEVTPRDFETTLDKNSEKQSSKRIEPAGEFFGRFRIEMELGHGTFGVVYRALDPQLDRIIALKVPRFQASLTAKQVSRFLAEAKAAAKLHHPNIVAVHDAGRVGENYYIASAYVKGCTLREMLRKQGRPTQTAAARLIAQLADALAYAHRAGVIHRDIKPENILLSEEGTPYIADFGLARSETNDVLQTRDGTILGTPAYMSPEQAEGNTKQVDGRSDQWALGVIFYELLCGERPFQGAELQLLYSIRHDDPQNLAELNPTVHIDLVTICLKCLMKEANSRYARCEDLRDDLESWLKDLPIAARQQTIFERLTRWFRRNPAIARLTTTFLSTVLISVFAITGLWIRAEFHRREASENSRKAIEHQKLAEDKTIQLAESATTLARTNERLESANDQLEIEKSDLNAEKQKSESQLVKIKELYDEVLKSNREKQLAEAARESESIKNSELRYIGEIHGAKLVLKSGKFNQCKELLASTPRQLRSTEYYNLSQLADYAQKFTTTSDLASLSQRNRNFFLSLFVPTRLVGGDKATLLNQVTNICATDQTGESVITRSSPTSWLPQYLPAPTVFSEAGLREDFKTQVERLPPVDTCKLIHVPTGVMLRESLAVQAWLSPDSGIAIMCRPDVRKTVKLQNDNATEVITVSVFQKLVATFHGEGKNRDELMLNEFQLGDLVFSKSPTGNITLQAANLEPWHFYACDFSIDSTRFALFDGLNKMLKCWNLEGTNNLPYIEEQLDDVAKSSANSVPIAWLGNNLAVAGLNGIRVLGAEKFEVVAESSFDPSISANADITFSESRMSLLCTDGSTVEVRDVDRGEVLVRETIPTLSPETYKSNLAIRQQATRDGIPIVDWGVRRFAEAPDFSWFCIKPGLFILKICDL